MIGQKLLTRGTVFIVKRRQKGWMERGRGDVVMRSNYIN